MIRIFLTKKENRISAVEITGHANYAKPGKDIVCSAVSSIALTALLGISGFSTHKVEYKQRSGYLYFVVPKGETEKEKIQIDAVMQTMVLGLRDIQKGYSAYIKMED